MSNVNELYPARYFVNITPSDSAILQRFRGIMLGVAGNVAIKDENDNTVVIVGLAAGIIHPISSKRIMSTGTTATGIVTFY